MDRDVLLNALKALSPGLVAGSGLSSCYICNDGKISTANESFTMWANIDLGITTAITGAKLQALLASCNKGDLKFSQEGLSAHITSGKSTMKITTTELGDDFTKIVEDESGITVDWDKSWSEVLEYIDPAMSDDPQRPELSGITFCIEDGLVVFYATDGGCVVRVKLKGEVDEEFVGTAVVLPVKFVKAITGLLKKAECVSLSLEERNLHATFLADDGTNYHLVGAYIAEAVKDRYENSFKAIFENVTWTDIPEGFTTALARASVMADGNAFTNIMVVDGKLKMKTISPLGTVEDELSLKGYLDVTMDFESYRVCKFLSWAKQIEISNKYVGLRGGNKYTFALATKSED